MTSTNGRDRTRLRAGIAQSAGSSLREEFPWLLSIIRSGQRTPGGDSALVAKPTTLGTQLHASAGEEDRTTYACRTGAAGTFGHDWLRGSDTTRVKKTVSKMVVGTKEVCARSRAPSGSCFKPRAFAANMSSQAQCSISHAPISVSNVKPG